MTSRTLFAVITCLCAAAPASAADNQIRPFFGGAFGAGTAFNDPDHSVDRGHRSFGISHVSIGNVFGWDVDVATLPDFFQNDESNKLVLSSRVTTVFGDVVIAAPRSKTEYGLRPYLVGGGGIMHARYNDYLGVFDLSKTMPAFDVGGGVVGFFTNRVGVSWEIRRFQTLTRGDEKDGLTISGGPQLSFWRASMAFVYRY